MDFGVRSFKFLLTCAVFALNSACSLEVSNEKLFTDASTDEFKLSVSNINEGNTVELFEGSALLIVVAQNQEKAQATNFTARINGNPDDILSVFSGTSSFSGIIPQGSLSGIITIPLIHNNARTNDHTFNITLESMEVDPVWSTTFNLTVKDLESISPNNPVLIIGSVSVTEGNTASFIASLSAPHTEQISFDYTTADLTAIAGTDYITSSGSVIFYPGETSKTINVNTIARADNICTADKEFTLNVSNIQQATLAQNSAQAVISENENPTKESQQITLHSYQFPTNVNGTDGVPYEMGIRIKANATGEIHALRYLQALSEAGAHIGHI